MALIPMIFKADGGEDYPKKGKIRAEDLSALFAFSLSKKTGVLDLLGKCSAYDVVVSNGYATITFHNGYIVICGRLIYIEESTSVTISLVASGTVSGKLGVRVSLSSTGGTECEWFSKTTNLEQDDLNNNPIAGVYEMALYDYSASPTTFVLGSKVAQTIVPISDVVPSFDTTAVHCAKYAADTEGNALESKGTIDGRIDELKARLDAQGFRTGNGTNLNGATSVALKRKANYVICTIKPTSAYAEKTVSFTVPNEFRPTSEQKFLCVLGTIGTKSTMSPIHVMYKSVIQLKIETNGNATTTYHYEEGAEGSWGSTECDNIVIAWEGVNIPV